MVKLVKVQTGPSSYIKMTEDEAKAYRKNQGEYAATAEAKAEKQPAETKARTAPVEKKAD